MVRSTILILVIGAMISMFVHPTPAIGKTTSTDVSEKAHDTWETFKAYVIDQKHKAIEHGKELLKKSDTKIEEMESKAAKASGDTKAQYQESIKKLKKMQANASKKLDELENRPRALGILQRTDSLKLTRICMTHTRKQIRNLSNLCNQSDQAKKRHRL